MSPSSSLLPSLLDVSFAHDVFDSHVIRDFIPVMEN